jgi:mannose-6-phosphate isomerase-like protein (cupin superfamily)
MNPGILGGMGLRARPFQRLIGAAALLGAGVWLGASWARSAGTPAPVYDIENSAKTFKPEGLEKTDAGHQYWFFDKTFAQGRTIKMSVVGPHRASHAPHQHEGHEFFFVLQGTAEFFLDGKKRVVGPQTALYCPPGSLHGISNPGDVELRYLVIKDYPWPPP